MTIAVVTSGSSNASYGLGFTATAGRIIVAAFAIRQWNQIITLSDGWVYLAKRDNNTPGEMNAFLCAKLAAGGETVIAASAAGGGTVVAAIELTGATLSGAINGGPARGSGALCAGPAVIAVGPGIALGCVNGDHANVSTSDGYTIIGGTFPPANENDWPRAGLAYKTGLAGTYTPQAAMSGGDEWGAASAFVYAAGSGRSRAHIV